MIQRHRECLRCVMATDAAGITFDYDGHCNYCSDMLAKLQTSRKLEAEDNSSRLAALVDKIKHDGRGKPFDCIVGVSGGADSSYALYLARENGLRPLAVHMDNGWNSELAVNNIERLLRSLKVNLYTHVVDWREYRALQQAFFDADVIDVELLYDNAMLAVNYQMAARYGVKYILSGSNTTTEGMRVPSNYNWNKFDRRNILSIAARGGVKVKSLPTIGVLGFAYRRIVNGIRWVPFLDYVNYDKEACINFLVDQFGYRKYPYKHYESVFTRFYQGYILPEKFGVDKRRLHFSSLICSGQMERGKAKELLKHSPYPDPDDLEMDIDYFLRKMDWSPDMLDAYLRRPPVSHADFGSEAETYKRMRNIAKSILKGATR